MRNYVSGPETLVIGSSKSGDTEETLSAFAQAQERGVRLMAISTGGKIAAIAEKAGIPAWRFAFAGQPRAAVGYSFVLLLGLACRLGLYPDAAAELDQVVALLKTMQVGLVPEVPHFGEQGQTVSEALYGKIPAIGTFRGRRVYKDNQRDSGEGKTARAESQPGSGCNRRPRR